VANRRNVDGKRPRHDNSARFFLNRSKKNHVLFPNRVSLNNASPVQQTALFPIDQSDGRSAFERDFPETVDELTRRAGTFCEE